MRTRMLALALGLLALNVLPALPSVGWLWGIGMTGVLCLVCRWAVPGLFLLGFAWACCSAQWALDDRLRPELEGRTLWLEGRVVGLAQQGAHSVRFSWPKPPRAAPSCRSG